MVLWRASIALQLNSFEAASTDPCQLQSFFIWIIYAFPSINKIEVFCLFDYGFVHQIELGSPKLTNIW